MPRVTRRYTAEQAARILSRMRDVPEENSEAEDDPNPILGEGENDFEEDSSASSEADTSDAEDNSDLGDSPADDNGDSVPAPPIGAVRRAGGRSTRGRGVVGVRGNYRGARGQRGRGDADASQDFHLAGARGRGRPRGHRGVPGRGTAGHRAPAPPTTALQDLQIGENITGKDGTRWTVGAIGVEDAVRRDAHNVLREAPGPSAFAKRNIDQDIACSAWSLFITRQMLTHIQRCTQTRARAESGDPDWSVSLDELDAFIAILYARGAYGSRNLELDFLWSQSWGPSFFTEAMGRDRFREIMRYLRFVIRTEMAQRLQNNKFALCSDIWDPFIENCKTMYKPGSDLTIDEQLFPSKARCPFTQYMPNKPDKFGIKFWMLCDANSKYMCNAMPYLGKEDSREAGMLLGEHVVTKLAATYLQKGRNITTDNYFTTVKLAKELKKNKTSLVGTVNRARREVPAEVKVAKCERYTTVFLKNEDATLTVYQGKKEKNVIVMSTMHPSITLGPPEKLLPETVAFYNKTKAGVDAVDQMARLYSVRAASHRWPVHIFYNILDLAAINAWILYKETTSKQLSRHEFLRMLAEELGETNRMNRRRTPLDPSLDLPVAQKLDKRRKCQVLERCKGNKSSILCSNCKKIVCGACTAITHTVCQTCNPIDD